MNTDSNNRDGPGIDTGPQRRWQINGRRIAIGMLLAVQILCFLFFAFDILGGQMGLRDQPISWFLREMIQVSALLGLILSAVASTWILIQTDSRWRAAETRLVSIRRAFQELMEEQFLAWSLTPAERDVALFMIKGCSTNEIADLRQTREGTVKAQIASIYRKAGVSSRVQLVSLFLEDVLDETLLE